MTTSMMEITSYLGAGYSCFWIETSEPRRAATTLADIFKDYQRKDGSQYKMLSWDCTAVGPDANPAVPIMSMDKAEDYSVMVLKNYHWFIDKPPIIQNIENRVEIWKSKGQAIIILSPKVAFPAELEKDFLLMELPLPGAEEIGNAVGYLHESVGGVIELPKGDKLEAIVRAGKGLAQLELENALARSFVDGGNFDPDYLSDHKSMSVERRGLFEVVRSNLTLEDIKGYDRIKEFAWPITPKTLGFMNIGPPGCGKTYFLECLCGQSGLPTFKLDAGNLMSKFQGESDRLVREAQALLRAVGECNLIIDEFEKQFAGAAGDGTLDSGTTRRTTGAWLQFLEAKNRPEGVHIYATANGFEGIPPEFLRPGRWDSAPFFIDLPTKEEQDEILTFWAGRYGDAAKYPPKMELWTGAEIEACCMIAKNRDWDLMKASRFILPQAITMQEKIGALRHWAMDGDKWVEGKGRAICASTIKIANGKPVKRKVVRIDK